MNSLELRAWRGLIETTALTPAQLEALADAMYTFRHHLGNSHDAS